MELKEKLKRNGLKAVWLANKVGITPTYLSLILNGKRKPSKLTLFKIDNVLNGYSP